MSRLHFLERSRGRAESGRASLEFLAAGLLLFLPVLVLSVLLWDIQRTQMAADAASRHAIRVFSQQTSLPQGRAEAVAAVRLTLVQWGVDQAPSIDLACEVPANCLAPGRAVSIRISVPVQLLDIPFLPISLPLELPITGEASAIVSRYRGTP